MSGKPDRRRAGRDQVRSSSRADQRHARHHARVDGARRQAAEAAMARAELEHEEHMCEIRDRVKRGIAELREKVDKYLDPWRY